MAVRDVSNMEQFAAVFSRRENQRELDGLSRIRFYLIALRYARVGPEWSTAGTPRSDGCHHMHFVVDGEAEVRFEGGRLALKPGHVYWLPAHVLFHCTCRRFYSHYFLTFRGDWVKGIDLFWGQPRPLCLGRWSPGDFVGQWRHRPLRLNAYLRLQGFLEQALAEHFDQLDSTVQRAVRMYADFGRVFDLIDRRLSAALQVADLARAQAVSLNAFSRSFRRHFGISPKTYLNRRLNAEACDLMLSTDLRAREIADRLGFADEYYFNRFFSKMNRTSPLRYRRRFRGVTGRRRRMS
jgi:AraC-like DNA-binding protein